MPAQQSTSFLPSERDLQMLQAIDQCSALTAPQLSRLFFPPAIIKGKAQTHSNCQYRLNQLYNHGYLLRYEQPILLSKGRKPYLYYLSPTGVHLLAQWLDCDPTELASSRDRGNQLSGSFLDHLMLINDVRVALMRAVKEPNSGVSLVRWVDERTLKSTHSQDKLTMTSAQGRQQTRVLVPDGYFHLHAELPEAHEYHHFLEVDRGTETGRSSVEGRRDWALKISMYRAYFANKPDQPSFYQRRYHTQGGRVMTVTTSETRLAHLKRITEEVGGKKRFWFTTFDKLKLEPLLTTPIWQIATQEGLHTLIY